MHEITHYSIPKIHSLQDLTKTFPLIDSARTHGLIYNFVWRKRWQMLLCIEIELSRMVSVHNDQSGLRPVIPLFLAEHMEIK